MLFVKKRKSTKNISFAQDHPILLLNDWLSVKAIADQMQWKHLECLHFCFCNPPPNNISKHIIKD